MGSETVRALVSEMQNAHDIPKGNASCRARSNVLTASVTSRNDVCMQRYLEK